MATDLLTGYVDAYDHLVQAEDERHQDVANELWLQGIRALNVKAAYPALLSAVEVRKRNAPREEFRELAHALAAYYVRHTLVLSLENTRLEALFFRVAKSLHDDGDVKRPVNRLADAAASETPDDAFKKSFQQLTVANGPQAKYLLTVLENQMWTDEVQIGGGVIVHLEHVYPRSPQKGQRWADHEDFISRLGNLTLLHEKLNRSAANRLPEKKKAFYKKSDLRLNRDLQAFRAWNPTRIEERQMRMADVAADAFSIDPL